MQRCAFIQDYDDFAIFLLFSAWKQWVITFDGLYSGSYPVC
jgi:hypothetical protein